MAQDTIHLRTLLGFNYPASTVTSAMVRSVPVLGENPDVDSGTVPETIWEVGSTYVFPTTATVVTITSDSINDVLGTGSGAWIVLVEGLNSNWEEQWEVVNLNGTNNVTTVNSYLRVNAFRVVYSGSGKSNAGNITATVDSKTVRYIGAGESLDHTAVYSVAKGHTFFPINVSYSNIKSSSSVVSITTNVFVNETNTTYESAEVGVFGREVAQSHNLVFPKVPEKSDYWFDATYASTTNIEVFVTARGLLVKNGYMPMDIQ